MRSTFSRLSIVIVLILVTAVPAETKKKDSRLAKIEKKLLGKWHGMRACQGNIELRKNGTFAMDAVGPGGDTFRGRWQMEWNALPPTLVFSYAKEDAEFSPANMQRARIIQLDEGMILKFKGITKASPYERPVISEARALEIAKRLVDERDKWSGKTVYQIARTEKLWVISASKTPNAIGGQRVIRLTEQGHLLKYVRGQ